MSKFTLFELKIYTDHGRTGSKRGAGKNGISQKALCKKGNLQNKGSRKRNLSMRSQR